MRITKWAALAVALGALAVVGCEMPQSAPLEMLVEAPRTLRAAGHTTLEVSQVSSTRDRVRITHWPDNVTDAYFSSGTVEEPCWTERHIADHHDQVHREY